MSLRAVFTRFDHFMTMFVAMFAVVWSTVFMPLLGGPLHVYEAQAIGVGWQSLRSGEAANIREAMDIAAALPAEILLPAAAASEIPLQADVRPEALELLGGPDVIFASSAGHDSFTAVPITQVRGIHVAEPACAAGTKESAICRRAIQDGGAGEPLAAST